MTERWRDRCFREAWFSRIRSANNKRHRSLDLSGPAAAATAKACRNLAAAARAAGSVARRRVTSAIHNSGAPQGDNNASK